MVTPSTGFQTLAALVAARRLKATDVRSGQAARSWPVQGPRALVAGALERAPRLLVQGIRHVSPTAFGADQEEKRNMVSKRKRFCDTEFYLRL